MNGWRRQRYDLTRMRTDTVINGFGPEDDADYQ